MCFYGKLINKLNTVIMDSLVPFFLLCFTSFFTLANPLGTMPVFLTMTSGVSEEQRRAIVRRATIMAFLTLIVFTVSGQFLFTFFGISTNGFRIAGAQILQELIARGLLSTEKPNLDSITLEESDILNEHAEEVFNNLDKLIADLTTTNMLNN